MTKFQALLKFELMTNSSRYKDEGFFFRFKKALVTIVGGGALALIFLYAINMVMGVFIEADLQHEFITIFSALMMLLHLIVGVITATKILFTKVDLSILKLPVGGLDIFLAKFLYVYIKQLGFALLISLPTFVLFGIKTMQTALFYVLLLPNVLFLPIIPVLLAVLLSVPVMWLIRVFKNKFIILLLFYTLLLVAGFMTYIYVLKFVLNIFESGHFSFDAATIYSIRQFSTYLYLPILFKNLLLLYNYLKSLTILLTAVLVLAAFVYLFAKYSYFSLLISSKNQRAFSKKTKIKYHKPTTAFVQKEFKTIFRSTNYAFQYLTIVFTTPLMVYFSSEIVSNISTPTLGSSVLPGIVVLVLIMFLSMGTSFSATSITREGNNFFLTKIIPVSYTKQITVKFLIYLLISIPAIFISCLVLAIANFITYPAALIIACALSFVITGNISNSISMDIKRPQFEYIENGELSSNTKNTTASIGIGFTISFIMGVAGIVLSLFVSVPSMYLVLYGFGVPFALIELFRLFHKLERKYERIEV